MQVPEPCLVECLEWFQIESYSTAFIRAKFPFKRLLSVCRRFTSTGHEQAVELDQIVACVSVSTLRMHLTPIEFQSDARPQAEEPMTVFVALHYFPNALVDGVLG